MGMTGLREMLKALKRTHSESAPQLPSVSDASASTESSIGDSRSQHYYPQVLTQRRRVKTSIGPESIKSTRNQNQTPSTSHSSLTHKSSPRRPASIFRLGQRNRTTLSGPDVSMDSISNVPNAGKLSDQSSTTEEEDWDCMDSASDFEHAAQALESADGMLTVKGKKGRSPYLQELQEQSQQPGRCPITPKTGPAASRSSIFGGGGNWSSAQHTRSTRLSNVEENVD
jgi:serine/arginine repetitive matrix protein 2